MRGRLCYPEPTLLLIFAADFYGSAKDSNPEEVAALISRLEDEGVEIISHGATEVMAYGSSPSASSPGQMHIWDGMSWSAYMHEADHYNFDKEHGFPGMRYYFSDPAIWDEMERRAYDIEIALAKENGDDDLAVQLEKLQDEDLERRGRNG